MSSIELFVIRIKMMILMIHLHLDLFRTISAKFMDNGPPQPQYQYPPPPPPPQVQQANPGNGGNAGGNPQLLQDTASLLNINTKF